MQTSSDRPRLPALTSLRFFAALHVFVFHLHAQFIYQGAGFYRRFALVGYMGVSLFFVLSGFILVYVHGGRDLQPSRFWRERVARIYPAYLFSLVITGPFFFYVCLALKDMDIPFFAWFKTHLALCAALVPSLLQAWIPNAALAWNAPAWSLSVEAFFYLLFPFLLRPLWNARRRNLLLLIAACWLTSLALSLGYQWFRPDGMAQLSDESLNLVWLNALKYNPIVRLPEFVLGAACGVLFLRRSLHRRSATPLIAGGLAAFLILVGLSPSIPYAILHTGLAAPASAAIILGLALRPAWTRWMEVAPLVLLGNASYSLYLLHGFILGLYFTPMGVLRPLGFWGTSLGLLLPFIVAVLVYFLIEEPARRKLRPARPLTAAATAAPV